MLQTQSDTADASIVLGRAASRAAEKLGLTPADLADIVGRDRTSISRRGIDPASKPGELALLLIRCYRSLAVLVNDNQAQIRHWMRTNNLHTGGTPAQQLRTIDGLVNVTTYLDAIRARV